MVLHRTLSGGRCVQLRLAATWSVRRRGFAKRMNTVRKGLPEEENEMDQLSPKEQDLLKAQQKMERRKANKAKKKSTPKNNPEADNSRSSKALLTKWMNFLKPEPMVEYRTKEQLELDNKWAKRYTELKLQEHKENYKKENVFWETKQAAIAALPPRLRKAATVEDLAPWPLTIPIPCRYPGHDDYKDPITHRLRNRKPKPQPTY